MPSPQHVLVVDDNPTNRRVVSLALTGEGLHVTEAEDGESALACIAAAPPDLVLLDLRMPGIGGFETLKRIKASWPALPVLILTAYGDVETAVQALQLGAEDFLVRPVPHEKLTRRVKTELERCALASEVAGLRQQVETSGTLARLQGASPAAVALVAQIRQVAASPLTVLVQGETGTGKELVARALHENSPRHSRPFVALDCGAIPETLIESELFGHEKGAFTGADRKRDGYFQLADTGTLFLDEVGNLSLQAQARLLRVLQERQVQPVGGARARTVDVRVIAATHMDLQACVANGRFRQDLYFRLAEFTIFVPPLRERQADVARIARALLAEATLELRKKVVDFTDDACELLATRPWPGNVRELRSLVRQAVLLAAAPLIDADGLHRLANAGPAAPRDPHVAVPLPLATGAGALPDDASLRDVAARAVEQAERGAIVEALRRADGNKAHAARLLQTDYKTLYLKLKRYGLAAAD